MFRRLFLAASAALLAAPLWAEENPAPATADGFDFDKVSPVQVRYSGSLADGTFTITILPGWVAVNGGTDGAIYGDFAGGDIWIADDKNGRLISLSGAAAIRDATGGDEIRSTQALDEAFAKMEAILQERLEGVREDQRPAMEQAMRDAMGLPPMIETVGGEAMSLNIYELSDFQDDQGRDVYRAEARSGGELARSFELVGLGDVPEAGNIVKAVALLVAMHRQIMGDDLPGESLILDLLAVGATYFIISATDHRSGESWKLEGIRPYALGAAPGGADALHKAMASDG